MRLTTFLLLACATAAYGVAHSAPEFAHDPREGYRLRERWAK